MERPRDAAYAEAAANRGHRKRSWFQEFIVLVLTIAIGTGGVWAARQLRAPVDSTLQARTVLEEQIRDRSAISESLRQEVRDLRTEISERTAALDPAADAERRELIDVLEMHAGTSALEGPGIVVVLTEPAQPSSAEELVLDADIQIVVNGLWAAGAEAITVNGKRLAFGTAIRTAGEVILVDLEPVQSPYEIAAIGDADMITRSLQDSPAANHLRLLNSSYRIKSSVTQVQNLQMPAGDAMKITYADPIGSEDVPN